MHSNSPYDALFIGAGQAAMPLSIAFAKAGWKTAMIEREHVGGTCLNEGCTPTKTMIASGRVAYLARRAAGYGISTGPVAVDMHRVRQRKREVVESFVSSSERRILAAVVDLIWGEASFHSANTLDIRLNSGESKAQGRNFRVAKIPMNYVSRALEVDETRGLLKAVVDADTCQILGFTALSLERGEMMAMVEIAMMGNLPYTALKEVIFAHPTLSEALNTLFASLE